MKVYQAIGAVSAAMSHSGIAKGRSNQQQGYKFRGIDDVYNALAPIISKHGLVILPRVMRREVSERMGKTGSSLFYVVVEAESLVLFAIFWLLSRQDDVQLVSFGSPRTRDSRSNYA